MSVMPGRPSPRPQLAWPPAEVRQVTDVFLSMVDEAAPGLVEGLYFHGSLGFGEWYDGRSDIDYVAVTGRRLGEPSAGILREVHAQVGEMFPRPPFDGFHLTWDDLERSPYVCPDVPCTQGGYFHEAARLDVHPVTWHELARHGVSVRGPDLDEVDIWTDDQVLRQYTRDNLHDYWLGEVAALRRFPDEAAEPDVVAWFVLGVARLHHVLSRNALTSKTGAGRYALEEFGARWQPVVAEALAIRVFGETTGEYDGESARRGRDTIDFSEMVIESGLAIPV